MYQLKSIVTVIAAVFLFAGSIGFDVFAHFCEEDGLEVSYFVENDTVCESHDHDKHHENQVQHDVHESACCDEEDVGSCCTTTATHLQVKLDFFHKILVHPILVAQTNVMPVWHVSEPLVEEDFTSFSGSDPPPKQGRQLLVEIQQWLI